MQRSKQPRKSTGKNFGRINFFPKTNGKWYRFIPILFFALSFNQLIAQCDITSPPQPISLIAQLGVSGAAGLSADVMVAQGINSSTCPYPVNAYHFYDNTNTFIGTSTFLSGPIVIFSCSDVAAGPITIFVSIDDDATPGGNESSTVELSVTVEDNENPTVTCPTLPALASFGTNYDDQDNNDCRTAISNNTVGGTVTAGNSTSFAIPDNNPAGVNSTVSISGIPTGAVIDDINISGFALDHEWVGNLTISLSSPTGETLNIMSRPGTTGGGPGDSSNSESTDPYNFNDGATTDAEDLGAGLGGGGEVCQDNGICDYSPSGVGGPPFSFLELILLMQSNGSDPNGVWTLNVSDNSAGTTGTLEAWNLNISYSPGIVHALVSDNCPGSTLDVNYANPADPNGASIDVLGVTPGSPNNYEFYAGTTTVTYTATDASGGNATCSFTIDVTDDENPTWDDPEPGLTAAQQAQVQLNNVVPSGRRRMNVVLNCQDPNYAADYAFWTGFQPTASDNCASSVTVSLNFDNTEAQACITLNGYANTKERVTRLFSADDGNGNTLNTTDDTRFRVRIYTVDNTAPSYDPATAGVTTPTGLSVPAPTPGKGPLAYSGMDLTVNTNDAFNSFLADSCKVDLAAAGAPSILALPADCSLGLLPNLTWSVLSSTGTSPAATSGTGNNATQIYPVGTHLLEYKAVDECGQESTFTFNIVVIENTPPIIVIDCPAAIGQSTDIGVCEATVQWLNPTASDCSGMVTTTASGFHASSGSTILIDLLAGGGMAEGDFPIGVTTVTYSFTDNVLPIPNVQTCSFVVTINDGEAPTIAGCADQTINSVCPNATVPNFTGSFTISDNCPGATATQVPAAGTPLSAITLSNDVGPVGLSDGDEFLITITPTDGATSGTSCTITATLMDLDEPIPAGPLTNIDASNTLGADCGSFLVNAPIATDCNGTVIFGTPSVADGVAGPNQYIYLTGFSFVTWTYDDGNGNTATQSQTITITDDTTTPTVNAGPDRPRTTDPGVCTKTMSIDMTEVFPTTAPYLDASDAPGNSQYIDNCGVSSITFTLSGDLTAGPAPVTAAPIAFPVGTTTVTYTATDAAGLIGTDNFDVVVTDNQIPVPTCSNYNLQVSGPGDNSSGDCSFSIASGDTSYDPTATDNCGPVSKSVINISKLSGGTGSTTLAIGATTLAGVSFDPDPSVASGSAWFITWEFTDANGLMASCGTVISVFDGEFPTITCAADATRGVSEDGTPLDCAYTVQGTEFDPIVTNDNCQIDLVWNNFTGTNTLAGYTFANGSTSSTYTVTWSIRDVRGLVTSCDVDITITDDVPPTLSCLPGTIFTLPPSNTLTIDPNGLVNPFFTGDVCSFANITMVPSTFTCADATNMPIDVIITATDVAGNMATCNTTVTIQENVLPTVVVQDITIQLDATGNASFNPMDIDNGSTDNCTPTANLIYDASQTSFDCTELGPNSIVLTVTDASGNSDTGTATVTVEDNVNPEALCAPQVANLDASGVVSVSAIDFDNGSTDNAGSCLPITYGISGTASGTPTNSMAFDCSDVGSIDIYLTVTDGQGLTDQCMTQVTIVDNVLPTAMCQDMTVMLDASGQVVVNASSLDNGSTDNCDPSGASLAFTIGGMASETFDCDNIGENTVILEVTDNNGQMSTCTSTVTVLPYEVAELTIEDASGGAGAPLIVPVTISKALDVRSIQFTLDIGNTAVAEIVNATSPLAGTIVNVISTSKVAFSFVEPLNIGEDFMDGDVVLNVEVLLVGSENDVTSAFFNSSPTPIQISQGCGVIPFQTSVITDDGVITIDPNSTVVLSGNVTTNDGDPVDNIVVTMSGDESGTYTTTSSGYYEFVVPSGSSVTLEPLSDMTPTRGVTSLDLAIIQAHIVSGGVLNNPYKHIAANPLMPVGGFSASITSADLALIQGAIVSFTPTLQPFSNSFKFVESDYLFTAPTAPWTEAYPQTSVLNNVLVDQSNLHFTAIKMGDVNDTWPNLTLIGPSPNRSDVPGISIDNKDLSVGETTNLNFYADNIQDVIAMQATLQFDTDKLRVTDKQVGQLPNFPEDNIGFQYIDQGLISLIWFDAEPLNLENGKLVFSLEVEALENIDQLSDVLVLTERVVTPQSYASNTEAVGFGLTFNSITSTGNISDEDFQLLDNRPNPFSDVTTIGFNIREYTEVKMSVIDISGRVIWTANQKFDNGYQEVALTADELGNGTGIFFFQLETENNIAQKKLIRIQN